MENLMTRIRPSSFSEMIGCEMNKKSFLNHIKNVDGATYLLSGDRGSGKTSFARLMAKKICKKYKSPTDSIVEVDTAVHNKVDNAREIIDELKIGSFFNSTVYIFDEFHEATKKFQDDFLKTFENPPKNTFFILCTTEPEKISKASLSRCTRYLFSSLNKKDFKEFISNVQEKESVEIDEELHNKIFDASMGIPREVLSIIESIIPLNNKESIKFIENYQINSADDNEDIISLNMELLKMKSLDKCLEILKGLNSPPETVRRSVLNYFYSVITKPFGNKEETRLKAAFAIQAFKGNVYDSGKAGLALAIYEYFSE